MESFIGMTILMVVWMADLKIMEEWEWFWKYLRCKTIIRGIRLNNEKIFEV